MSFAFDGVWCWAIMGYVMLHCVGEPQPLRGWADGRHLYPYVRRWRVVHGVSDGWHVSDVPIRGLCACCEDGRDAIYRVRIGMWHRMGMSRPHRDVASGWGMSRLYRDGGFWMGGRDISRPYCWAG